MKILIIEDNIEINNIIAKYLVANEYSVLQAYDGITGINYFENNQIDLILLDIMLGNTDGISICQEIRKTSTVPIIMLTALAQEYDKVRGLEAGADDYIVKPFSNLEVVARIKALLRRSSYFESSNFTIDNLTIKQSDYSVTINDINILLTKTEFDILWLLANNSSKSFTRENIINSIWSNDHDIEFRVIDAHIKRLRHKLNQFEHLKWDIKTIWKVGYKFEIY